MLIMFSVIVIGPRTNDFMMDGNTGRLGDLLYLFRALSSAIPLENLCIIHGSNKVLIYLNLPVMQPLSGVSDRNRQNDLRSP